MDSFIMEKNIKFCKKCSLEKEHTLKGRICKDCKKDYDQRYVDINRIVLVEKGEKYREKNLKQKSDYDSRYRIENASKIMQQKQIDSLLGKSYRWAKNSHLKRKYNITLIDFNNLLEEQTFLCKICLTDLTTLPPHKINVDHCHITNKVRGILCSMCNLGLGHFKDDIQSLENAIKYLKEDLQ